MTSLSGRDASMSKTLSPSMPEPCGKNSFASSRACSAWRAYHSVLLDARQLARASTQDAKRAASVLYWLMIAPRTLLETVRGQSADCRLLVQERYYGL